MSQGWASLKKEPHTLQLDPCPPTREEVSCAPFLPHSPPQTLAVEAQASQMTPVWALGAWEPDLVCEDGGVSTERVLWPGPESCQGCHQGVRGHRGPFLRMACSQVPLPARSGDLSARASI